MEALTEMINEAEERVSDIEDKIMENKEAEERKTTTGSQRKTSRNQ